MDFIDRLQDPAEALTRTRLYEDVASAVSSLIHLDDNAEPMAEYRARVYGEPLFKNEDLIDASSSQINIASSDPVEEAERASQVRGLTRENLQQRADAYDMLDEVYKEAA